MKNLISIILAIALSGCSLQQIDDAFILPMPEYDAKWYPEKQWPMEDIHVYVNLETSVKARKSPEFRNRTCLPAAEAKYELAQRYGYNEDDLEIVVIKLNEDTALKADWSKGWPTHAVLRYKNEIFDNGFISRTPFDVKYLSRYGEVIFDQWSKYRKTKQLPQ